MSVRARHVCIVGAGAAGLSIGLGLARRGWKVTIVDGGGRRPATGLEDTYRVVLTGTPHRGVHEGRFRGWGGSTARWGGQLWSWERHEFEPRPWLGLDGWPVGYESIAPYYDDAFELLGIRDGRLTSDDARRFGVPDTVLDPERFALKYSTWLPWRLRNLGRTVGRDLRRLPNVTVQEGATAVGIVSSAGGSAEGVRIRGPGRDERVVPADVVVLAAGAIESTRLLLASRGWLAASKDGDGWLGRAFMDHLSVRVARFEPRHAAVFARTFSPIVVGGAQYTPRMLLRPSVLEHERLLAAYGHWDVTAPSDRGLLALRELLRAGQARDPSRLRRLDIGNIATGVRDVLALAKGIVVDHRRWFPQGAEYHLRVDSEQRPDPESRITLLDEHDENGLPRVALDWRVSEFEKRTVIRTAELLGAELESQGIGTLAPLGDPFARADDWGELKGDSFHMMGGTRMSIRAEDGVVDSDLRMHDVDNLYVASTSVFPTGGMANPTLTLIALSLRLVDHLTTSSPRWAT